LIAAFLFGVWHIPWALKVALSDSGAAAEPLAWRVLANFLPEALVGVVWGYLYPRTSNLWGPWAAHMLTNSAINFVHIESSTGMDARLCPSA
jgi:membrane protease YdiL (CAAX protease family)